jgi:hypothetical protein
VTPPFSSQSGALTTTSGPNQAVVLFHRLKGAMNHYKLGGKLLWKNYKIARELKRRVKEGGSALSHNEEVFLRRWRSDFAVGVPFVILLLLPVIGDIMPLFALLAPRYIPATFHTPAQVLAHVRLDARAAHSSVASLKHFYGLHPQDGNGEQLRALLELIELGTGKVKHLDELQPLVSLFASTPSLGVFPREHLLVLHRALLHAGFLPRFLYPRGLLVRDLEGWRNRVWAEDQPLMRAENGDGGVDALTVEQLVRALYDRGLYRQPIAMGAVLSREQTRELDSVESADKKKEPAAANAAVAPPSPPSAVKASSSLSLDAFDPPVLPPPPSDELVAEWRQTLREWLALHARLVAETEAAGSTNSAPLAASSARSATVSPSPAPPAVAAAAGATATSPSSSFPLSFLVHVGPLARDMSTDEELAALQTPDASSS